MNIMLIYLNHHCWLEVRYSELEDLDDLFYKLPDQVYFAC